MDLSAADLREVTRYAADSAAGVLHLFEHAHPEDRRPRAALDAARLFVDGADRSRLQRVTATDAHRAAKDAASDAAAHAAHAAGDAAAAAYLHPLARATQVGHILRAAAHSARAAELAGLAGHGIDEARRRATPELVDVLLRYPHAPAGRTPVGRLMTILDTALRAPRERSNP